MDQGQPPRPPQPLRLDSSAAWTAATRLVAANRDMLVAIAGVFFLLPGLAGAVFAPTPAMTPGMTDQQMLAAMQDYYAGALPLLLLLSMLPMVGMLTMLVVMLDGERPTVGQAIGRSLRALPSYFAAQLLVALVALPVVTVAMVVLARVFPEQLALAFAFAAMLYPVMRTMLVGPVLAVDVRAGPINAIRRSLRVTRGNSARILTFIGLAGFLFLVVYGLVMMVVGVLLVVASAGEVQRLLGEGVGGVLLAVAYTYFVAMLAAIYRQLGERDAPHPATPD